MRIIYVITVVRFVRSQGRGEESFLQAHSGAKSERAAFDRPAVPFEDGLEREVVFLTPPPTPLLLSDCTIKLRTPTLWPWHAAVQSIARAGTVGYLERTIAVSHLSARWRSRTASRTAVFWR